MNNIDIVPVYDIEVIILNNYNEETKKIILSNLRKYIKLKIFECYYCNIKELHDLPNSLKELDCRYNNLTELPNLPNSIIRLNCCNNNLTELPELPNSLKYLGCINNNLTKLPDLPNSLITLNCCNNNLTELPELPNSLKELYCVNNNLTELPDLPNSLYFKCYNNPLTYPNYPDYTIETINGTNSRNRIIKRMKLLNRTLLLEHSAMITMNPKRIERLLDNLEIDFYDGSFDNLT